MLMSAVLYGVLITVLVYGAAQAQAFLVPGFFPISWQFSDPVAELPIDLLLFHFAVPYAIDFFKPREVRACIALP